MQLMNLNAYQKVVVGMEKVDAWGSSYINHGMALQFHTASQEANNTLDMTMKAAAQRGQKISTNGYETLNLEIETSGVNSMTSARDKFYSLDIRLVNLFEGDFVDSDQRNFVSEDDVTENHWTKASLSKIVVAGGAGLVNGEGVDSLFLNLSPVIDLVDVSGYKGHSSIFLPQQLLSTIAGVTHITGNILFKIGAFGIDVNDSSRFFGETVTTFQFMEDAVQSAAKPNSEFAWEISMFEGGKQKILDNKSKTVLDVSALNVHGMEDFSMLQSGHDAVLRGKDGQNFKIVLSGTSLDSLSVDNFIFAA